MRDHDGGNLFGLAVLVQDAEGKPINNAQVTADNRVVTTGGNGQAGFEDCTLGMSQPITVMAQPTEEIGRTATELLFQRIQEPSRQTQLVMLNGTLIARESSARRE